MEVAVAEERIQSGSSEDAFVAVNGIRAKESLKGLLPKESHRFDVAAGGDNAKLEIECDRLVPGQHIGLDAKL